MSQPELQREPAPDEGDEEADDELDPAFVARFGSGRLAVPGWLPAPASGALPWTASPRGRRRSAPPAASRAAASPRSPGRSAPPAASRAAASPRSPARSAAGPGATIARVLAKALAVVAGPARPSRAVSAEGRRPRGARRGIRRGAPEGAAPGGVAGAEAPTAVPPPGLAAAAAARDRLAWPLGGLLLGAYLGLLALAAVAPAVAGGGGLGVTFALGLAALTAAVAVLYPRLAAARVDPLAAALGEQIELGRAAQEPGGGERPELGG